LRAVSAAELASIHKDARRILADNPADEMGKDWAALDKTAVLTTLPGSGTYRNASQLTEMET
jgi:hypothetical protein